MRGHHPEFVFTYIGDRTHKNPRSGKTIARGERYPMTASGVKTTWRRYGGSEAGLDHHGDPPAARNRQSAAGPETTQPREISTTTNYAHASDEDLRAGLEAVKKSARIPTKPISRS